MSIDLIRSAQISTSLGVGGREIVPAALARQLQQHGHPTWLICPAGSETARLGLQWGVALEAFSLHGYLDLAGAWKLAAFLKAQRIQIVHAHWSRDLAPVLLAAFLAGRVPVVLTKHVYATQKKRDLFHDVLYRRLAAGIGVSELVSKNLAASTALAGKKIVTIYNGLDLKVWDPRAAGRRDLRREFGVPAGAPVVGYVGRWNAGKGLHLALQAFQALAARFPDWHWVAVGRAVGPAEEAFLREWRQRSAQWPCAQRLHWLPYREDMPDVMATLDVLICASEFETFGMVLIEAMAMERAVIGALAGGVKEIIRPGANGLGFAAGDLADLTRQLETLLGAPELRKRLGLAGRRDVEARFNAEHTLGQTLALYRNVLGLEY